MISVIIPVFNGEGTIRRALDSVYQQTFQDIEIVIVDDGSTDNTKKTIEAFFKNKALSFQYVYQSNQGPSAARNRAASLAKGDYLAFLDADDEWHPNKLELQLQQARALHSGFVAVSYTYETFSYGSTPKIVESQFNDFLVRNRTSTPCVLLSKQLFQEAGGFFEHQRYSEDYSLWLRVSKIEPLYTIIQPPLVRLHKHAYGASGLSSELWMMEKGELSNYKTMQLMGYINRFQFYVYGLWSLLRYGKRVMTRFIKRFGNG